MNPPHPRHPFRPSLLRQSLLCALSIGATPLLYAQATAPATADLPEPTLERCASIGAPTDRLACYDRLANRAPGAPPPPGAQPSPGEVVATPAPAPAAADAPSLLEPTGARLTANTAASGTAPATTSLVSKFWELDPEDKRGVFNFVGYQKNYILPIHITSRINRSPQSPTQPAVAEPDNRREEAKFQLSVRTKVLQDFGLPGADLWAAFTMQTMWQVYNHADSRPFRNTDYQPEMMYVVPTGPGLRYLPFGWQWRYSMLGVAHQSNGQSDPLSRSWNRAYLAAGFERGNWNFTGRYTQRLSERPENDNNPDLVDFRGRTEFTLGWASGLHTASVHLRGGGKGNTTQLEWTYPVYRDQPNGLRWYVQVFSGYGETLSDYNFRQTSVGAGVSFLQF